MIERGNEAVLDNVHAQLTRLVINKRLPLSFSQDEDLSALLNLASNLKPGSYAPMARYKQDAMLMQIFKSFVESVRKQIVLARASNSGQESQTVGFIVVMHDGWDSALKSMFGVSIAFINAADWTLHKIALSLATPLTFC